MATLTLGSIKNAFDTRIPYIYSIEGLMSYSVVSGTATSATIQSGPSSGPATTLFTLTDELTVTPFKISTLISPDEDTLYFVVDSGGSPAAYAINLQYLRICRYVKATIQDSDMRWAGRRTSYYEGCKLTGADFNINSPDTIDGGPVVEVRTVSPNSPTVSTSVGAVLDGRAIVNQSATNNNGAT